MQHLNTEHAHNQTLTRWHKTAAAQSDKPATLKTLHEHKRVDGGEEEAAGKI